MPAKAKPTTGRSSNDEISTGPAGDAVVQKILDEDQSLSQYDAENRKYKIDSAMLEQLNVAV